MRIDAATTHSKYKETFALLQTRDLYYCCLAHALLLLLWAYRQAIITRETCCEARGSLLLCTRLFLYTYIWPIYSHLQKNKKHNEADELLNSARGRIYACVCIIYLSSLLSVVRLSPLKTDEDQLVVCPQVLLYFLTVLVANKPYFLFSDALEYHRTKVRRARWIQHVELKKYTSCSRMYHQSISIYLFIIHTCFTPPAGCAEVRYKYPYIIPQYTGAYSSTTAVLYLC